MPKFEVEFEVFCGGCGAGLCRQSEAGIRNGYFKVTVEPCERCVSRAASDAKAEGYADGHDDGYQEAKGEDEAKG